MRYNAGMHYLRRLSLISFAAAILLMIAMCHPPMAFFRPMKIAVCAFGIVAACLFWRRGSEWRALLASAIAILFNPIWPVYLGRANWRPLRRAAYPLPLRRREGTLLHPH